MPSDFSVVTLVRSVLTGEAVSIVILDTFVALMTGFIIIPALHGVNPDSGPSLYL